MASTAGTAAASPTPRHGPASASMPQPIPIAGFAAKFPHESAAAVNTRRGSPLVNTPPLPPPPPPTPINGTPPKMTAAASLLSSPPINEAPPTTTTSLLSPSLRTDTAATYPGAAPSLSALPGVSSLQCGYGAISQPQQQQQQQQQPGPPAGEGVADAPPAYSARSRSPTSTTAATIASSDRATRADAPHRSDRAAYLAFLESRREWYYQEIYAVTRQQRQRQQQFTRQNSSSGSGSGSSSLSPSFSMDETVVSSGTGNTMSGRRSGYWDDDRYHGRARWRWDPLVRRMRRMSSSGRWEDELEGRPSPPQPAEEWTWAEAIRLAINVALFVLLLVLLAMVVGIAVSEDVVGRVVRGLW